MRNSMWEQEYQAMFRIRPYTEEEQEAVDWEPDPDNPQQRIEKIIMVNQIDRRRYEDAKVTHPHMADHMTKMQDASLSFVRAMVEIYQQDHGITFDETGVVDMSTLPRRQFPTIVNPEYVNRPA